mmetsp:Transcript_40491/g.90924  ORF Transcript_40491/g.90924 Transcript_40491/m.90924 type:complete len:320 (+) Transcript_40491:290-1249(+)
MTSDRNGTRVCFCVMPNVRIGLRRLGWLRNTSGKTQFCALALAIPGSSITSAKGLVGAACGARRGLPRLGRDGLESVASFPFRGCRAARGLPENELVVVVGDQARPVPHRDVRAAGKPRRESLVHGFFGVHVEGGGGLVEDGHLGFVRQQAPEGETLLLPQTQHGAPVHLHVQPAHARRIAVLTLLWGERRRRRRSGGSPAPLLRQSPELDRLQELEQKRVLRRFNCTARVGGGRSPAGSPAGSSAAGLARVQQVLTEGSWDAVGLLREEHHFFRARAPYGALARRPEARHRPQQRALARPGRSDHQEPGRRPRCTIEV